MAGETLGTARLLLTVDTTDFDAQVARSKNAAAGLGAEAEASFSKLTGKVKRAATSLTNYADRVGFATDESKLLNAALAGVPLSIIEAAATKIETLRQGIANAAAAAAASAAAEKSNAAALAASEASAAESALALRKAAENDLLREQARVVAALTAQFNALEAAEAQQQDFALANAKAVENEAMREQQRVVRVLTERFNELEAAEREAARGEEFIASLQQQAFAIDKTRSELLALKAAELGVADAAAPFIAKLKAQEGALRSSGIAFNQYGLSVKQTQAALRQVPAQLTDIFVSLQGGQAPLTVLLQQGGQLKDVFGGVVPAVKALGGAILGLINPYTILAGVVAGLAVAYFKGAQEAVEFNKAIINSGNRAGMTARELGLLAKELDGLSGVSTASASAALTQVVANGQIAAGSLELVTRAALAAEKASGAAIKDTVAQFVELGKDPVTAVLKLNDAQNFLTAATFEQIRALEDQGRTQDAATVATEAYADSLIERSNQVRENLGVLEQAWKYLQQSASEAWDAMLNVGRAGDLTEELAEVEKQIGSMEKRLAEMGESNVGTQKKLREQLLEDLRQAGGQRLILRGAIAREEAQAVGANAETVANAELIKLDQLARKYESESVRRLRERNTIIIQAERAEQQLLEQGKTEAALEAKQKGLAILAAFDEKNKDKTRGPSARVIDNAEARAGLQQLKDILAQQRAVIAGDTKELEALFKTKQIGAEEYYAEIASLVAKDGKVQEQAIIAQIALLQNRDVAGKDSIDVQRQLNKLEADRAVVLTETTTKLAAIRIEEQAYTADRLDGINDYIDALNRENAALAFNVNAQIASIAQGQRQADMNRFIAESYEQLRLEIEALEKQLVRKEIDKDQFDILVQAQQDATDERVRIAEEGFARMKLAEADWLNGVSAGVANWVEENSNVAAQVERITTSSLDRTADALAEFALTGKLVWKDFLSDILKQIAEFFAKQAVLDFVKLLGGSAPSSSGGGILSSILGAVAGAFTGNTAPTSGGKFTKSITSVPSAMTMPATLGAKGGSNTGSVNITIETNIATDGTASVNAKSDGQNAQDYKQFVSGIRAVVVEEIGKSTRQGGALWKIGVAQK